MARSPIVRSDKSRDHMLELIELGANTVSIAGASGVSTSIVRSILRGDSETITRAVQNKILAVKTPPVPLSRLSIGAARRMQALAIQQWDLDTLAEELGVYASLLSDLRRGKRKRINRENDEMIKRVYESHRDRLGPSALAAARGRVCGWVGPKAWEGVDIDNPRSVPNPE